MTLNNMRHTIYVDIHAKKNVTFLKFLQVHGLLYLRPQGRQKLKVCTKKRFIHSLSHQLQPNFQFGFSLSIINHQIDSNSFLVCSMDKAQKIPQNL